MAAVLLKMPAKQPSRRAPDGPISAIYAGRAANNKAQNIVCLEMGIWNGELVAFFGSKSYFAHFHSPDRTSTSVVFQVDDVLVFARSILYRSERKHQLQHITFSSRCFYITCQKGQIIYKIYLTRTGHWYTDYFFSFIVPRGPLPLRRGITQGMGR